MTTTVGFNPMAVQNAPGFFGVQSDGFTQGIALDDPAVRYQLAGGQVASTETVSMWGGLGITESVIASNGNTAAGSFGNLLTRASSVANITGFTVFNQGHNAINWPENQVPVAGTNMTMNFYRLGSLARIPLAADPSLVASLATGSIVQQVTWDTNNQRLVAYDASTGTVSITSITSSYAAGVYTMVVVCAAASNVGAVGDTINISGVTGTGAALVNGNQIVTAFTDNQHFTFQVTAASGAIATGALGGTIVLNQSTGALACKILKLAKGNSRIVSYNPVTGNANWLDNQSVVLVQI